MMYDVLNMEMAMAGKADEAGPDGLDALLGAMPRIAEAVKAFPEGVQSQAFDALMAELRGTPAPKPQSDKESPSRKRGRGSSKKGQPRAKKRKGGPTTVKDLDLAPKGKDSLKDFAEKKKPKTNHDRNVVSVYYLQKIAGIDAVSVNHVFTCFKDMGWREPANLANSLALTANRKRYLDTSNLDDIRLTPAGRNHVEHDLPPKKKG
jgi:hypothetical protein